MISEDKINFYGEELRRKSFVGEGLGCYANFEIHNDYIEVANDFAKSMYLPYFLDMYYLSLNIQEIFDCLQLVKLYINYGSNTVMAYYWDGDGSLLFITPHYAIINRDCKKINNWKELNS
jgi:hypothetical protein